MATCDSTQQPGASTPNDPAPSAELGGAQVSDKNPLFRPFQWHHDALDDPAVQLSASALMQFAGQAKDVVEGLGKIMEIAEADQNARFISPYEPMFAPVDLAALMRLGITSANLLAAEAEQLMDSAYETGTPQGRREHRERAASLLHES